LRSTLKRQVILVRFRAFEGRKERERRMTSAALDLHELFFGV
jgi:hypothetical protein